MFHLLIGKAPIQASESGRGPQAHPENDLIPPHSLNTCTSATNEQESAVLTVCGCWARRGELGRAGVSRVPREKATTPAGCRPCDGSTEEELTQRSSSAQDLIETLCHHTNNNRHSSFSAGRGGCSPVPVQDWWGQ